MYSACHSYSSSVALVSTMPRSPEPTLRLVRMRLSVGNIIQKVAIKESEQTNRLPRLGIALCSNVRLTRTLKTRFQLLDVLCVRT